jgi:hypothetical protein
MAQSKTDEDAPGASWTLLTHLLDLLADKGILTTEDLTILAEAAHAEVSTPPGRKRSATRLKRLRDKVKARG